MTYEELKARIEDLVEYTFEPDMFAVFVQQVEQIIFQAVDFPALRVTAQGNAVAGNKFLSVPADFLSMRSVMVTDGNGRASYVQERDSTFLREAYPSSSTTGLPKYYAMFDEGYVTLAPVPDSNYTMEIHYNRYPESIVTAGSTWLGDKFDNALVSGVLVEAARFNKAEQDVMAIYSAHFERSMMALKELGGKLKQDSYRAG